MGRRRSDADESSDTGGRQRSRVTIRATSPVRSILDAVIAPPSGPGQLITDLGAVTFLDSSGNSARLAGRSQTLAQDGAYRGANPVAKSPAD